ncbi:MAG TPA: rod shape-determining protein MreC [Rudaea sp.]|nr:rod shape-determining protein MreC [Rudaea sp.]
MTIARNDKAVLFAADAANALRLIGYLALAIILMVIDHRGGYLSRLRWGLSTVIEPMYRIAAMPSQLARDARMSLADRSRLTEENAQLRRDLLLAQARLDRVNLLRNQNRHLKQLLDAQRSLGLGVQLARIIDVNPDPFRQRVTVDAGSNQNVHVGQAVLDAQGVMGQVVDTLPNTSTVMLITDAAHAIPVVVDRTGMRAIAHGSGQIDTLKLPNVPISADIKVGDKLMTSGLGGHFPAGFPVGIVGSIQTAADGMFVVATATPSAALDRSVEVLILHELPDPVGPPAPAIPLGPPGNAPEPAIAVQGAGERQ